MDTVYLTLPWPPSGNHSVKHTRVGGHYLTNHASQYFVEVAWRVKTDLLNQGLAEQCTLDKPLAVRCVLFPPDLRKRDMDNAWKVIADAVTRSGLWADDHLVRDLHLQWGEKTKGGRVQLKISETSLFPWS